MITCVLILLKKNGFSKMIFKAKNWPKTVIFGMSNSDLQKWWQINQINNSVKFTKTAIFM